MEETINVAEKLKDCPKGTELYSPIFGTVYFEGIRDTGRAILIDVTTSCNTEVQFYSDGKFNTYYSESEVTLFPSKENRDWSKFYRPFLNGDILVHTQNQRFIISIYNRRITELTIKTHCILWDKDEGLSVNKEICCYADSVRFATEEEKAELFKAIRDNGYEWNERTKTLAVKFTYPDTYEECCNVIGVANRVENIEVILDAEEKEIFLNYIKLRRCRNAYWKLANDWKPDWIAKMDKYTITTWKGRISLDIGTHHNQFLVFPTKKMRDEFYSNFKSLIEECKEFL